MTVCYRTSEFQCTVLIESTVAEVGWNDRYIVATRQTQANTDLREYYYIDRNVDTGRYRALERAGVFGPFNEAEFEAESHRLSLPPMRRYAPFIYCSDRPLCSPLSDVFR